MMPLISAEAVQLLSAVPVIQRARGWRLYTADGTRILDLYADGGRMLLGRRGGSTGKVAKEMIDRGLLSALPSFWQKRLENQIRSWLPDYAGMLFFPTEIEALMALATLDEDFSMALRKGISLQESLADFSKRIAIEAPFGEYKKRLHKAPAGFALEGRYALALLPLAPVWSFGVVLAKKGEDLIALASKVKPSNAKGSLAIPAWSTSVPALKLAAGARSLADFAANAKNINEAVWAAIDPFISGLFVRSGPWLYPCYAKAMHSAVFAACLAAGILISPDYDFPSIVPGEFDAGEVAPLRSIIASLGTEGK